MLGETEQWDPWTYLEQRYPGVRVVRTRLSSPLQGCLDRDRGIIWLDERLAPVQARCTLAYEIGLLQAGSVPGDPCLASVYRRAAQEWAALMLVTTEQFAGAWAASLDLASMAASVGVDVPTFRARIRAASDADQDAAIEGIARTRLSTA